MKTQNIFSEVQTAEYEKIRKFVVGQIAKAGSVPMRLASNRELAKLFGVSQPTVVRALKDLIADDYLTIKPGIGAFTNPAKSEWPEDARLIGIVQFGGKNVFHSRSGFDHYVAEELMRRSRRNIVQSCFLAGSLDHADKELAAQGLSAVVWLYPSDDVLAAAKRLESHGIKTVFAGDFLDGFSSSWIDHVDNAFKLASRLLDEGRRKMLLSLGAQARFNADVIAGVERAFAERGLVFDHSLIHYDTEESRKLFAERLATVRPDSILFSNNPAHQWKAITETLDIADGCRLCATESFVYDDMDYSGYLLCPDFKGAAVHLADCLEALLEGRPPLPPEKVAMEISFRGKRGCQ